MTRQQRMMRNAIDHVNCVAGQPRDVQKKYGGLCHNFPVMIRQCGLCQAMAFMASKGEEPHRLILDHAQEQLGLRQQNGQLRAPAEFAQLVAGWGASEYALKTRLTLQAFTFYKRFAESILDVKAGEGLEDAAEREEPGEEGTP